MAKLLLVEDDINLTQIVKDKLELESHSIDVVHDGDEAKEYLKMMDYDLVILDWTLPGQTGIQLCQTYRSNGGVSPILMLTAHGDMSHKEAGFEAGVDDYLTKPFNVRELVLRVKALLNRGRKQVASVLTKGDWRLDKSKRNLTHQGQEIVLSKKEYELLEFLMSNNGKTFNADQLIDRIWSSLTDVSPAAVRTLVKRLRAKVKDSDLIENIHGLGYRIVDVSENSD